MYTDLPMEWALRPNSWKHCCHSEQTLWSSPVGLGYPTLSAEARRMPTVPGPFVGMWAICISFLWGNNLVISFVHFKNIIIHFKMLLYICECVREKVRVCRCFCALPWRLLGIRKQLSVLSSFHSKCFYPMNHLVGSKSFCFVLFCFVWDRVFFV